MAQPFLRSVADYIFERYKDNVENLCIVLPNKRAALFLKNHLASVFSKTIWLPQIISAEELVEELSGLKTIEEIDLICHLYESYKKCYGQDAETFDSFAKWGQLILQDFNEIDRYLADSEQLYENLKDIKVIENWSLGAETLTEYQTNYLRFMNSLGAIYKNFSSLLIDKGWAYQGLAYKHAVKNISSSTYINQFHKIIFAGFNALNAAELKIFNSLYSGKKADILWDADKYYLEDKTQEAGMFLRRNFDLFAQKDPQFIENNLIRDKEIRIISVPKQIGQAQIVKQTLQRFIDEGIPMDKVAVVLANEKLLWPVLQQLPASIEHINITMEYPLRYTATYGFIDQLIHLQLSFEKQKRTHKTIYYSELVNLLRQPLFANYLQAKNVHTDLSRVVKQIAQRNLSFITQKNLEELFGEDLVEIGPILKPVVSVSEFCVTIVGILNTLIGFLAGAKANNQNNLELEYLQIILLNFNRLSELLTKYSHFRDLQAFKQLFVQVVGTSSAPFIGEPLKGLQIMGVLETRTLDFKHLIIVNVNEGVLPSGKTINSFIPNDLKRAFGLPLYLEKDAIYAYHFYRLLQKTKDVTITYDSETDTFGKGEKSRFVNQLQMELLAHNPTGIKITEEVASYPGFPPELPNIITIEKNKEVLRSIVAKAASNDLYGGLSPSGLISYKECSLKFYFRYGVHLKETKEVEENAEANTFGSILHLSLEKLYKDFIGKIITAPKLKEQKDLINETVNECFISFFDNNPPVGKSILQQEVIKVYVKKLMDNDIRFINELTQEEHYLTLQALEKEFSSPITVKVEGEEMIHYIKGKIDRIYSYKGFVRIIDFKSSVKDADKFTFDGFYDLFFDMNYNKQLQLFIYAWLLYKNNFCAAEKIRPCIIPFKVFAEEPKYILGADKKPLLFTNELFDHFEIELTTFINSIFDPTMPFGQTDDEKMHEYCPYKAVCNFNA